MEQKEVQRRPAEELFREELDALKAAERYEVPAGWNMSPRSVLTYILGGKAGDVESRRSTSEIGALSRLRSQP